MAMYRHLVRLSKAEDIDWSKARGFALDEYLDVDPKYSFGSYLAEKLYDHVALPGENRFDPQQTDDYDRLIAENGGLDITILGIGINGHIAFNEPGTPRQSWTHSVPLTQSTIEANRQYFKNSNSQPSRAVTMGIGTILSSRKIILMAFGKSKKEILSKALYGPIDSEIPASYLKTHDNLHVLTDFDCAQLA